MQTGGAAAETGHGKTDDPDLPKALIKKIVKAKLASLDAEKKVGSSNKPVGEVQVSKDAVLACSESAKVFISYLTAIANDNCIRAKRQTISAEDVITALSDTDFTELIGPLKESLEAFKAESKEKSKAKAEQTKKRKLEKEEAGRAALEAPLDDADDLLPDSAAPPQPIAPSPVASLLPASGAASLPSGAGLASPTLLVDPGLFNPGLLASPGFYNDVGGAAQAMLGSPSIVAAGPGAAPSAELPGGDLPQA